MNKCPMCGGQTGEALTKKAGARSAYKVFFCRDRQCAWHSKEEEIKDDRSGVGVPVSSDGDNDGANHLAII